MAVRNQAWHNRNESRAYPFDDGATLVDDTGNQMPTHVISGMKAMIPRSAGQFLYVSAMSVTPKIVTVVIMATDDLATPSAVPVLSISVSLPADRHQQYEFESLYPGAGGWLTFGAGLVEETGYVGRFTAATQALLAPRAAKWYKDPPIGNIGKLNSPGLTGLVSLIGGTDFEIVKECREVPGKTVPSYDVQFCGTDELGTQVRDTIVFRLKDKSIGQDQNVYDIYRGQCGDRPESGNCGHPDPIEFLGPVSPDCCGNITLNFRGCAEVSEIREEVTVDDLGDPVASDAACGVVIDCGIGLSDACVTKDRLPDEDGKLPNEYDDLCESVSFISVSEVVTPDPEDPPFVFDPGQAADSVDAGLPVDDDFEVFGEYVIRNGDFKYRGDADVLMTANSSAVRNVVTYEPDPALNNMWYKRIIGRVILETGPAGGLHNAAVIGNYKPSSPGSSLNKYYVAEIDWDGHYRGFRMFRIGRYTGSSWVTLFSIAVPDLKLDDTYELTLDFYPQPGEVNAWLRARLLGITDPSIDITIGPLAVNNVGPADGLAGMGTNRAVSRFTRFEVQNITSSP